MKKITRKQLKKIIKSEFEKLLLSENEPFGDLFAAELENIAIKESEDDLWSNPKGVWDRTPTLTGFPREEFSPKQERLLKNVPYGPDAYNLSRTSDDSDPRAKWLRKAEEGSKEELTDALNKLYKMRNELEKAHFGNRRKAQTLWDKVDNWTQPFVYASAIITRSPTTITNDLGVDMVRSGARSLDKSDMRKLAKRLSDVQFGILRLEDAYRQKESGAKTEPEYNDPLGHLVDIDEEANKSNILKESVSEESLIDIFEKIIMKTPSGQWTKHWTDFFRDSVNKTAIGAAHFTGTGLDRLYDVMDSAGVIEKYFIDYGSESVEDSAGDVQSEERPEANRVMTLSDLKAYSAEVSSGFEGGENREKTIPKSNGRDSSTHLSKVLKTYDEADWWVRGMYDFLSSSDSIPVQKEVIKSKFKKILSIPWVTSPFHVAVCMSIKNSSNSELDHALELTKDVSDPDKRASQMMDWYCGLHPTDNVKNQEEYRDWRTRCSAIKKFYDWNPGRETSGGLTKKDIKKRGSKRPQSDDTISEDVKRRLLQLSGIDESYIKEVSPANISSSFVLLLSGNDYLIDSIVSQALNRINTKEKKVFQDFDHWTARAANKIEKNASSREEALKLQIISLKYLIKKILEKAKLDLPGIQTKVERSTNIR